MQPAKEHAVLLPARGQVRLHVLPEPADLADAAAALFEQWLSPDERERLLRFRHRADRNRFLMARALVRRVLGEYVQQSPESLQFSHNLYGKPTLEQGSRSPEQRLQFNVSHTPGLLVLAATLADEVGVDVERLTRDVKILPLAERYFSGSEVAILRETESTRQREYFFLLWTLKEAYVKATGVGLQTGLDSFAFDLAADSAPRLLLANAEEAKAWSFFPVQFEGKFRIAAAVRAPLARLEPLVIESLGC